MKRTTRDDVWNAVRTVYKRHDGNAPLNHVNTVEWVDAVMATLSNIEVEITEEMYKPTRCKVKLDGVVAFVGETPDYRIELAGGHYLEPDETGEAEFVIRHREGE